MKKGAVALTSIIAAFCVYQAFLSGPIAIDRFGEIRHERHWWAVIQAALATLSGVALLADFVIVAALCALVLFLVSFMTFFGGGFWVVLPAAALALLIALHSQRKPSPTL